MKNGIREGYWTLYGAAVSGTKILEEEMPMEASSPHIRHCIDLLRQTLMCQPDTTVELKNDELGGVTGFGTEHQCKDWTQLMQWTTHWENYNREESHSDDRIIHSMMNHGNHGGHSAGT